MSVATAIATLARATRFLGAGMTALPGAAPRAIDGVSREKVIGNGLRELDRFLSLLIDEVAAAHAPALDPATLRRQRNTANKLRDVRAALLLPSPDHARLRAIGRARDCLFHTAGRVHGPRALTGWRPGRSTAAGDRVTITAADLSDLCAFYDRVSADLIAQSAERSAAAAARAIPAPIAA